jgi:hypothetical protein
MANQIIVTQSGNVQVSIEPPSNVQVQISRAAIGTVSNVPTANFANFAGNVTASNQPNITSVGTLGNLNVSNTITTNNLVVTGNFSVGNLVANNANFANFAGVANTANSVAVANVSGIGNIATINLDGNASNILFGNGTFSAIPVVSNVANANFANFAGTAFNVSGSNVSGEVANAAYANAANTANLATFATTANSVAGANVAGTVANANYAANAGNATIANSANSVTLANVSGAGNIASLNLDGNASNILYGNGVFATTPIISNVANANYANFAGEAFNVNASNITGTVANANYSAYAGEANTANLATFATTANAVAGANVSGEVANANFASYSNIAASANSVALANVVGIGNIANINLDGSSSNVLFGNGVFAPESTSIANANYANFAGNLINGTSNISIPVANGNALISVAGNANVITLDGNGTILIQPKAGGYNNFIRMEGFGRSGNVGGQRVAWQRARGNITVPASMQANDVLGELLWFGHNGTSYQTNSISRIQSIVDSGYTTGNANIPLGFQVQVNDTSAGTNQLKTHNFYSNGNVVFANVIFADGGGLSNIAGANVSGQVANALIAGTVYTNAQPNITSVGNLVNLNVVDSANVTGTIQQLAPNTITITTNATNNTAYDLTTIYGETSNIAESGQRSIIRSRGNASTPTTAVVSDVGSRDRVYFYNGTTNAIGFSTSVNLTNLNSNSNAFTTGASYNISVGAPSGDQGNANANSAFNTLQFNQNGQLVILPGSTSTVGTGLSMTSYGQNTNLAQAQGITFSKARGNRDANLSVNAGDTIGRILFQAHNGNSFVTNRLPIIRATVDSTYSANAANVPAGIVMVTCDSNTSYSHNFYANGATVLSGNLNTMGGSFYVTKTTAGAASAFLTGDKTTNSTFTLSEAQFSVTMSNVDTTTGYSPFRFQQYAPTNNQFGAMYMYRARGDDFFTQAPVVAGDEVLRIVSSVNSNNAFASIGYFLSTVSYNDNAGNVAGSTTISAVGSGTTGYLNSSINLDANTTSANNISANNVSIFNGGNLDVGSGNAVISANGYISTNNEIDYLRTFGSFTSNATQTNSNVGNAVYMTLNNDEGSNGVSIVSSSQITVARTGRYNLQFSAQLEKTDGGTDQVEIWLTKNGSAVANSATQIELKGNGAKDVAAWNWVDNVTTANTYYQIAWGSSDANAQLTAIPSANTLSGVAVPSLIVTVVPVGA